MQCPHCQRQRVLSFQLLINHRILTPCGLQTQVVLHLVARSLEVYYSGVVLGLQLGDFRGERPAVELDLSFEAGLKLLLGQERLWSGWETTIFRLDTRGGG